MGTIIELPNRVRQRLPAPIAKPVAQPTFQRAAKTEQRDDGARIGSLIFRCPSTAHDIESGIEMDLQTFRRIAHLSARVRCSACNCTHRLEVADGFLEWYRLPPCANDFPVNHPHGKKTAIGRPSHGNVTGRPRTP